VGVQCVDCVKEATTKRRAVVSQLGIRVNAGPPVVTYALIVVNIAIFLYGLTLRPGQLFSEWGLWPHYDPTMAYAGAGTEWWRWISSAFVHGGWLHIGMNMFVLWSFGREVEQRLGKWRFVLVYAVSLVGGSALVAWLGTAGTRVGGASGAIFGIIAAFVVIATRMRLNVQFVVVQAGAWLVLGLFLPGIAWQGHLGGALAGWVATTAILDLAKRRRAKPARRE